jgi:hypothetical protein
MSDLYTKSTKTLSFVYHFPITYSESHLINIIKKYDLDFKILSVHKLIDKAEYIKPKQHIRIQFSQKQKLDYKLYSAMFELGIWFQPFITNSQSKSKIRQQFDQLRDQLLTKKLSEYCN